MFLSLAVKTQTQSSFRIQKDNSANIARRIIIGSVVGKASNRSMRSNCKRLGVSFQTLKQAIFDANNFDNAICS